MAYQEIVAPAAPQNVVDALRVFAEANGWTVMRNTLVGNNRTVTLKRPETDYVHIYNSTTDNIRLRGSIDYDGGIAPDATAGRSGRAESNIGTGPYVKLYMFAGAAPSAHVYFVVESAAGATYYHGAFGMVEKLDAWTGGTFIDCSFWPLGPTNANVFRYENGGASTVHALFGTDFRTNATPADLTGVGGVRCDIPEDSRVNTWAGFTRVNGGLHNGVTSLVDFAVCSGVNYSYGADALSAQPSNLTYGAFYNDDNVFSNRSVFRPIELAVVRIGGYLSPIGRAPNVRFCNISKFTDTQEITIGSDVWKVFPMVRRGTGALAPPNHTAGSENFGYAYKKVV